MDILTRQDARGRYVNPEPTAAAMSGWAFAQWAIRERRVRRRKNVRAGERLPDRVPDAGRALAAATRGLHATWVGHASFVLRVNGFTVLTDPVWSRVAGIGPFGERRVTPPGVAWDDLPPVDAVVLSHNHYDHLDVPTLKRLPRATPVLCPAGTGHLLKRLGFAHVIERCWWEAADVDGARFTLVPAQHFTRRGAADENRCLWGGWVIEADGHAAYFAGDTGWMDTGFHAIGHRFPDLDAAFLPIGAYLPRRFMAPVHLAPWEAGDAFLATGARTLVPMHWGTFRLTDEPMDAPPRELEAWRERAGVAADRVRVPRLGETLPLAGRRARSATPGS